MTTSTPSDSMVHWNNKQYLSVYIHDDNIISAISLDSNFKLRSGITPFKGDTKSLAQWLTTLNIKANSRGEPAGIKALCYQQQTAIDKTLDGIILNEVKLNYDIIDLFSIITFLNDNDGMHVRKISYPKTILPYVAGQLNIDEPKGTWRQAMEIATIYKKLTERGIL